MSDSSQSGVRIDRATPSDAAALLALMERAHLPTDGLASHLDAAFVAREGERIVGSAAIEIYADGGLLRSVAVDADRRGTGLGAQLTTAAIEDARRRALPAVYLLTTTAEQFFPRFGFERITREDVPSSVQASIELREACPASATAGSSRSRSAAAWPTSASPTSPRPAPSLTFRRHRRPTSTSCSRPSRSPN